MSECKNATLGLFQRVEVEQLGYCNAFVRKCYLCEGDRYVTRLELVSYRTPVVAIERKDNGRLLLECAPAATCSATTRKHVSRFLNSYVSGMWRYYEIKDALAAKDISTSCRCIDEHGSVGPLVDVSGLFGIRYEACKAFCNGVYVVR